MSKRLNSESPKFAAEEDPVCLVQTTEENRISPSTKPSVLKSWDKLPVDGCLSANAPDR